VRPRQEFEKQSAIDWQIAADTDTPKGGESTNGCKVGTASCNHAENGCDANGQVERPSPAENVASEPPEYGAKEETDILGKSEELLR
jgi:hypothetical protein